METKTDTKVKAYQLAYVIINNPAEHAKLKSIGINYEIKSVIPESSDFINTCLELTDVIEKSGKLEELFQKITPLPELHIITAHMLKIQMKIALLGDAKMYAIAQAYMYRLTFAITDLRSYNHSDLAFGYFEDYLQKEHKIKWDSPARNDDYATAVSKHRAMLTPLSCKNIITIFHAWKELFGEPPTPTTIAQWCSAHRV